jgi:hypothetical protein
VENAAHTFRRRTLDAWLQFMRGEIHVLQAALTLAAALLFLLAAPAAAQTIHFSGMAAVFGSGRCDNEFEPSLGVRFIPEIQLSLTSRRSVTVDAEISANASGAVAFPADRSAQSSSDVAPYRAWLRFSTAHFEARAGLQKISFGSATLFRPLMWFDSLDPRDPLQLTNGVYALLLRYFTQSNAGFSAWTMYGNDARRGWDAAPSDRKTPEFGGRIQVPFFRGELGAAYHHRKAAIEDLVRAVDAAAATSAAPVPEDRFGLDGKWDLGVGLWLEGALVHQKTTLLPQPYQLALNAGLDYTFGVGNGLTAIAEHVRFESRPQAFTRGDRLSLSGLLLRYPLGLLDEVTGISYYDWRNRKAYGFLAWKRTYDTLSFNTILFLSPREPLVFPGQPGSSSYAGKGFQILFAYHF